MRLKKKALFFSALFHLGLLFFLLSTISLNVISQTNFLNSSEKSIPVKVYFFSFKHTSEKHPFHVLPHSIQPVNKTEKSSVEKEDSSALNKDLSSSYHKNDLVDLLHSAIAEHQIYPESALSLHQSGKVGISFILTPEGSIQDLKVISSSGNKTLDLAALEAVKSASPFVFAANYLKKPQVIALFIVFTLPG
mgnify:CR=1 FL=1